MGTELCCQCMGRPRPLHSGAPFPLIRPAHPPRPSQSHTQTALLSSMTVFMDWEWDWTKGFDVQAGRRTDACLAAPPPAPPCPTPTLPCPPRSTPGRYLRPTRSTDGAHPSWRRHPGTRETPGHRATRGSWGAGTRTARPASPPGGGGGGGGQAGEFDWIQACIPPFSPLSQLPKKGTFGLMTMASVASPTSAWAWARVRHTAVLPEPAGPSRKTDQRTPKISRS